MERTFPGREWQTKSPEELGFSSEKLDQAGTWLRELAGDEPFHFIIARRGYLVAEWNKDIDPEERLSQASAAKSYYSCLLGVAVAEGRIPSADVRVIDYLVYLFGRLVLFILLVHLASPALTENW